MLEAFAERREREARARADSSSFQAAPMPSQARPPDRTSRVVAALTHRPGVPVVDAADHEPEAGPLVVGGHEAERGHPSSIGSSTAPTPRIWKKWSMTQIESKPASSAVADDPGEGRADGLGAAGPRERADLQAELHRGGATPVRREAAPRPVARTGQRKRSISAGMRASAMRPSPRRNAAPRTRASGSPGGLAEGELGGRGQLVGDRADRRAHDPPVGVGLAAQVVERQQARHADRDVDDAPAPRAARSCPRR